ncbi:MAG: hypothetical protein QM606_00990 [Leucobacter sp.]
MTNPTAQSLIDRSNRLGADKKNTAFAGGNTSANGITAVEVAANVADAAAVQAGPGFTRTTGLRIPVDSGVAAAFLR